MVWWMSSYSRRKNRCLKEKRGSSATSSSNSSSQWLCPNVRRKLPEALLKWMNRCDGLSLSRSASHWKRWSLGKKMKEVVTRGRLARVQGGHCGSDTMLKWSNGSNRRHTKQDSLFMRELEYIGKRLLHLTSSMIHEMESRSYNLSPAYSMILSTPHL